MKKSIFSRKEEIVNDKHIEDWLISNGSIIPNFNGRIYEKKIFLKTPQDIKNLIREKQHHKKTINDLKNSTGVYHTTCRFNFGDMSTISPKLQEQLVDFQAEVFDDITISVIGNDITNFQAILDYAINQYPNKATATWIDINNTKTTIDDYHNTIARKATEISYLKYEYKKISTWLQNYIKIKQAMIKYELPGMLTGCNKRSGMDNSKNIAVSIIAVGICGFKSTCLDVKPPKKGFPRATDVFNAQSWEYDAHPVGSAPLSIPTALARQEYRVARLSNLELVNTELVRMNNAAITQRNMVANLFQNLAAQGL